MSTAALAPGELRPPQVLDRGGLAFPSAATWLERLRLAVAACLFLAMPASAAWLGLPVAYELAIPAILVWVVLGRRFAGAGSSPVRLVASVALDLVAITFVLAVAGGAANPFSALLLVHVALAATVLSSRLSLAVAGAAAALFGVLFVVPGHASCHVSADAGFSTHLYGMWVAFAVGAGLVGFFVASLRGAIARGEREIAMLRARAAESESFAALGTLAAGTAHELGTPLGTIAVLARETAADASSTPAAVDNAEQILGAVDRCRGIVQRMQHGVRERASHPSATDANLRAAVDDWSRANPLARVELDVEPGAALPLGPEDLAAALGVLLDNALQASRGRHADADARVRIRVSVDAALGGLRLSVEDDGVGVADGLEHRLGEPFLSTKEPGEGMGLGLFVVRKLLEGVGGRIAVERRSPRGTRVSLCFDASAA